MNDYHHKDCQVRPGRAARVCGGVLGLALAGAILAPAPGDAQGGKDGGPAGPVKVTVRDDKPVVVEPTLPVEDRRRINYQLDGNSNYRLTVDNKTMHLGFIYNGWHFDGQVFHGNLPGRVEARNQPLPVKPGARKREGVLSVCVYNNVRVTQTLEVVATKPPANSQERKRRLDAVVIRYLIENNDTRPHKVGMRLFMDSFWVDNDGCLHASPTTHPGKILDGVTLEGKTIPDYLQVLQRPNLKNPGEIAHFTYSLGSRFEKPSKIVLTSLGAGGDGWNVPAVLSRGDTAMAMFWEVKEIPAKGKRELAYAYGQGIATNPENEGKVEIALGGSFEPGKLFTVTAYVEDPVPGQSLTLELPPGVERVEGAEVQPVPPVTEDGNCLVMWRARVQRLGEFPLRVRSSNGVTYTKLVTVAR
jgi:hypothetical protein